jgi:hypothetical protein
VFCVHALCLGCPNSTGYRPYAIHVRIIIRDIHVPLYDFYIPYLFLATPVFTMSKIASSLLESVTKLMNDNYYTWKEEMENIFLLHGSYDIVTGTLPKTAATKAAATAEVLDKEARPLIFFTVNPSLCHGHIAALCMADMPQEIKDWILSKKKPIIALSARHRRDSTSSSDSVISC